MLREMLSRIPKVNQRPRTHPFSPFSWLFVRPCQACLSTILWQNKYRALYKGQDCPQRYIVPSHIMTEYDRRNGGHHGGYNSRKRRFRGLNPIPSFCNLQLSSQEGMTSTIADHSGEGMKSRYTTGFAGRFWVSQSR